jgi:hypothetical protein
MNKRFIFIFLLVMASKCLSDEQNNYTIKKVQKKTPKVTAQSCYEKMLSEMIWSSHINTSMGQNQLHTLSYLDETLLEEADQKDLQLFMEQEEEYIAALEQFAQAQKKRRMFHDNFKPGIQAKKKKK